MAGTLSQCPLRPAPFKLLVTVYLTIVLKRMEKKNASRYIGADPAASCLSTVNLPWRLLANPFLLVSATVLLLEEQSPETVSEVNVGCSRSVLLQRWY